MPTRKILPLVFLVAALAAPVQAATKDVSLPAVGKSLRQAFGGMRHDYFVPGRRVSDQIMMGLGVPNPPRPIADGNSLLSGCRPHSCDEKAAVIVTPAGAMLAAGLIYLGCDQPTTDCAMAPHLTLFLQQKNAAFARELQDWAVRQGYKGAAQTQILQH